MTEIAPQSQATTGGMPRSNSRQMISTAEEHGLRAMVPVAIALALGACTASSEEVRPPDDQLFFPTGVAVSPDESLLFALSANSELRYDSGTVTVFSLDTTDADYHDLEFGLGRAAKDTGGFYAKTHVFPQIAIDRLERTLAGHYELEVRKPAGIGSGAHTIEVRVRRKGTYVMARTSYVD